MSLQIWLPFNGSLVNQGVYNSTIASTSPQYSTSGKIGKALSLASNGNYTVKTAYTQNNNEMSICFWVNPNNPGIWTDIFSFGGNNRMEVSSEDKKSYTWYVDSGKQGLISSGTYLFGLELSTWSHVVITIDTSSVYFYVNGVLTKTVGRLSTTLANIFAENAFFYVGARVGNSSCYAGLINDFRVYDECLSPKQVKEISKGLVCHYALDGGFGAMPNLVPNQGKYSSLETALTRTSASTDGWYWLSGSHFIVEPSTTYTYSVCCDGTLASTHGASANPSVKSFTMWLYLCNSDTTKDYNNGGYDNPINFNSSNYNHKQIGNKHIWQYTTTSTQTHMSVRVNTYSNGTDATTVKFWQIKIEKGNINTPWIPNSTDSSYAVFNINGNRENDISGYGNHGIKSGTITYNSDTPRYSTSTVFNGSNTFIACGRGGMVKDEITLNIWIYLSSWSSFSNPISCTEGGGWNFEKNGTKIQFPVGTGVSSNTYKTVMSTNDYASLSAGWHMLTGTYDGLSLKIYIDGVLNNTTTAYTTKTPIFYNSANGIFIGAEAGGNQTTPAGTYFNGRISDFRIYATALSADDIKQLYQVSASIDNNGNVFCSDIQEV